MKNYELLKSTLSACPDLKQGTYTYEIKKDPDDNGDYTILLHKNEEDDHERLIPALIDYLRISKVRFTEIEQHILYDGTTSTNKEILLYGSAD